MTTNAKPRGRQLSMYKKESIFESTSLHVNKTLTEIDTLFTKSEKILLTPFSNITNYQAFSRFMLTIQLIPKEKWLHALLQSVNLQQNDLANSLREHPDWRETCFHLIQPKADSSGHDLSDTDGQLCTYGMLIITQVHFQKLMTGSLKRNDIYNFFC